MCPRPTPPAAGWKCSERGSHRHRPWPVDQRVPVCSRARRWMFVSVCVPIDLSAASKNTGMCQTARSPPCRCTRHVDALVMPTLTWPAREVDCAAITADGAAAGVSIYQHRGRAASSNCGGMLVKEANVTALLPRRALRRASPQHWRLAAPRQWATCSTHMQPSATLQVRYAAPGADHENQPHKSLTQTPPQLWNEAGSGICPLCRAQCFDGSSSTMHPQLSRLVHLLPAAALAAQPARNPRCSCCPDHIFDRCSWAGPPHPGYLL